jgi:ABC transport system ATP-binding/permease protein
VLVGGTSRHVVGYLQDFLFSPAQIQARVRLLSGGERNRLLLARLFSVPSNVLVLDEPTNDLDTETLSLLEERLLTYSGTILLVSHDRTFLNNVVTSTLVFESDGKLREYVGGYDDWLRQRREPAATKETKVAKKEEKPARARPAQAKSRLSFKDARELEALPQSIEALEKEQAEIIAALGSSEFYAANDSAGVAATNARLEALGQELHEAYVRWEELEDLGR